MDRPDTFTVPPEDAGRRLDVVVARHRPEFSRSAVQRLIRDGHLLLDGQPARPSTKVRGGSALELRLPPPAPTAAVAENIPLDVIYEDRDLIVVNKPAGLVVHPAAGHAGGTLVNALLAHCDDLSGIGGELRPGIIHRLDKDTSGLLVAAKNDLAHRALAAQIKARTARREYWALVWGVPSPASGEVDLPIGRHPVERKKMAVGAGRAALTRYRVLEGFGRLSLVECRLATGRTHQIRVHLSHLGHPVVGDPVYGRRRPDSLGLPDPLVALIRALPGQALHARSLGFTHPRTGLLLDFEAPPPAAFQALLDWLRGHP